MAGWRRVHITGLHLLTCLPALLHLPACRGLFEMGEYAFLAVYRSSYGMSWEDLGAKGNGMAGAWLILGVEWVLFMGLAWYLEQVGGCEVLVRHLLCMHMMRPHIVPGHSVWCADGRLLLCCGVRRCLPVAQAIGATRCSSCQAHAAGCAAGWASAAPQMVTRTLTWQQSQQPTRCHCHPASCTPAAVRCSCPCAPPRPWQQLQVVAAAPAAVCRP